jgi:GT2 family glycosyltransferase
VSTIPVIILHLRGLDDTLACLESARRSTYPLQPIVVDNGPRAEAPDLERYVKGWGEYVRNDRNLGFAAGVNQGLSHPALGDAEWALLLNNDAILARQAVQRLVDVAARADPAVAAVAPLVLRCDAPRRVSSLGGRVFLRLAFWPHIAAGRIASRSLGRPRRIDYAPGACLLIRRSAVSAVGPFDERYFAYNEDVDWGWRAHLAGYHFLAAPRAHVWHGGGRSSTPDRRLFLMLRNVLLFMRIHAPASYWPTALVVFVLYLLPAWSARPLTIAPSRSIRAVVAAITWHLAHRRLPPVDFSHYRLVDQSIAAE